MLREAHSVADHGCAGPDIDFGDATNLCLIHACHFNNVSPLLSPDLFEDRAHSGRVFANEIMVNDFLAFGFPLEDHLHDSLKESEITANFDMNELAGDRC